MPKGQTLEQRLFGRVAKQEDGCWQWTGCTRKGGYGHIRIGRKMFLTHRVAYEQVKGSIPTGLEVRHICDNSGCCNPEHLQLGTHAQNMQDRSIRGRDKNKLKTHCPSGHAYDEVNTYNSKQGRRHCLDCLAKRQLLVNSRMREKTAAKRDLLTNT